MSESSEPKTGSKKSGAPPRRERRFNAGPGGEQHVTDNEKAKRRAQGLCLYCGSRDHKVLACPRRLRNKSGPARRESAASSASDATATAAAAPAAAPAALTAAPVGSTSITAPAQSASAQPVRSQPAPDPLSNGASAASASPTAPTSVRTPVPPPTKPPRKAVNGAGRSAGTSKAPAAADKASVPSTLSAPSASTSSVTTAPAFASTSNAAALATTAPAQASTSKAAAPVPTPPSAPQPLYKVKHGKSTSKLPPLPKPKLTLSNLPTDIKLRIASILTDADQAEVDATAEKGEQYIERDPYEAYEAHKSMRTLALVDRSWCWAMTPKLWHTVDLLPRGNDSVRYFFHCVLPRVKDFVRHLRIEEYDSFTFVADKKSRARLTQKQAEARFGAEAKKHMAKATETDMAVIKSRYAGVVPDTLADVTNRSQWETGIRHNVSIQILERITALETLDLLPCTIGNPAHTRVLGREDEVYTGLLKHAPSLRSLTLTHSLEERSEPGLGVDLDKLPSVLPKLTQLRHVGIYSALGIRCDCSGTGPARESGSARKQGPSKVFTKALFSLPRLESLELFDCQWTCTCWTKALVEARPQLRRLGIGEPTMLDFDSLRAIVGICSRSLEELDLRYCPDIGPVEGWLGRAPGHSEEPFYSLGAFLPHCPLLRKVTLWTTYDGWFIYLFGDCPAIEEFRIGDAKGLRPPDLVEPLAWRGKSPFDRLVISHGATLDYKPAKDQVSNELFKFVASEYDVKVIVEDRPLNRYTDEQSNRANRAARQLPLPNVW